MDFILTKEYIECCKKILEEVKEDENLYFKRSLPICILDAVFSIGANYNSTWRVGDRYIKYYNLELKSFGDVNEGESDKSEHTITDLLQNVEQSQSIETFASEILQNTQRTSPTNGILKAQAALDIANIMKRNNINTISDFQNNKDKAKLNEEILSVHGQSSGIMLKYLYMLAGDVNTCKPDRWLHRFLQTFYPEIQLDDIQSLMTDTVAELKEYRPEVTVRMLDNAIWKYASQVQ